jgi:hypothetical protein
MEPKANTDSDQEFWAPLARRLCAAYLSHRNRHSSIDYTRRRYVPDDEPISDVWIEIAKVVERCASEMRHQRLRQHPGPTDATEELQRPTKHGGGGNGMTTVRIVVREIETESTNAEGGLTIALSGNTPTGGIGHCSITFLTAADVSRLRAALDDPGLPRTR